MDVEEPVPAGYWLSLARDILLVQKSQEAAIACFVLAIQLVYRCVKMGLPNKVYSGVEDMADEQRMKLGWTSVPSWTEKRAIM